MTCAEMNKLLDDAHREWSVTESASARMHCLSCDPCLDRFRKMALAELAYLTPEQLANSISRGLVKRAKVERFMSQDPECAR